MDVDDETFVGQLGQRTNRPCFARCPVGARSVGFRVPLVVRLEGTEVEQGREILAASNLNIITADGLTDAARKVVGAAAQGLARE